MGLGLFGVGEEAGGLDDDLGADGGPVELGGVALGEDFDLLAVDGDEVGSVGDLVLEIAEDGVVLEQVRQGGGGGEVVDGDEFDVGVANCGAEDVASDAAEAVNAYLYSHDCACSCRFCGGEDSGFSIQRRGGVRGNRRLCHHQKCYHPGLAGANCRALWERGEGRRRLPRPSLVSVWVRGFAAGGTLCYKRLMRDMREWMRDLMRRRSRRGPNNSESTGKSGQELPQNQPAPLRPSYPEPVAPRESQPAEDAAVPAKAAVPVKAEAPAVAAKAEVAPEPEKRMVVETQPDSLATPPGEAPAVSPKEPRGYVVLAIGLPGSGKTTWYKRRGVTPLSSDLLRSLLFDDITEQRYQGLVFSTLRSLLRARLIAKMPWNYVDATNLSPHERKQWIKMAKSFGYEVQAVFFDVPLAVCLERNSKRDRQVTDEVMHKMAERLRPPTFKEGFEKITVVRVKGHPGTEPAAGGKEEAGAESAAVAE